MNNKLDVAFYTKNRMRAYNMRNKCNMRGIDVRYLTDLGDFLDYLISCKKGIIILDLKYFKYSRMISEFCHFRNNGEYKFVYFTEDKDRVIVTDENICVYSYVEVDEFLDKLPQIIVDTNTICEHNRKANVSNIITNVLESYKISPKHIGFNYLKDCIDIASKNKREMVVLNKYIYPLVAKMYNTTIDNVEKNIRLAIKSASQNHPELYNKNTFCDGKITNRTFVSHVIEEVDLYEECKDSGIKRINLN